MENRRQALVNAGMGRRSADDAEHSWSSLLGEVSSRKAARLAKEVQAMVDRLGVLNQRIVLVSVSVTECEFVSVNALVPDRPSLENLKAAAGPAYQVYELADALFVFLYVGPLRAQECCTDIAWRLNLATRSKGLCAAPRPQFALGANEAFSHHIVEPMAMLAELLARPRYPSADYL